MSRLTPGDHQVMGRIQLDVAAPNRDAVDVEVRRSHELRLFAAYGRSTKSNASAGMTLVK